MIALLLTAVLFVSAVDAVAYEEPPYPTEVIHKEQITMDLNISNYKGLLRREADADIMPDAVIGTVECSSDGSGEITLLGGFKEVWTLFTTSGMFVLNNDMVTIASKICDEKLEEHYGYSDREGPAAWYF